MKTVTAYLKSTAPYVQSKPIFEKKLSEETHAEFEHRIWPEKAHADEDGITFIPALAVKNCFAESAKRAGLKIPGGGQSRYTKIAESGTIPLNNIPLGVHRDNLKHFDLFCDAAGKAGKGGGARVMRRFPIWRKWEGEIQFRVIDDRLLNNHKYKDDKGKDKSCTVFEYFLRLGGLVVGLGSFRVENRGIFGRYKLTSFEVS